MEREGAKTLHTRLVDVFERCEDVRRESRMLVDKRLALHEELTASLESLRRARAARRRPSPPDVEIHGM